MTSITIFVIVATAIIQLTIVYTAFKKKGTGAYETLVILTISDLIIVVMYLVVEAHKLSNTLIIP